MTSDGADIGLSHWVGTALAAEVTQDARPAVLWPSSAERALWASPNALALFGMLENRLILPATAPGLARLREFARTAPVGTKRSENLRFFVGPRLENLKAENRIIALKDGSAAVLTYFGDSQPAHFSTDGPPETTAVQAPLTTLAQSMAEVRPTAATGYTVNDGGRSISVSRDHSSPSGQATSGLNNLNAENVINNNNPEHVVIDKPVPALSRHALAKASPADHPLPGASRPLRFVFQTDATGTLTVLSPAFTQAVGISTASLVGRSLTGIVAEIDTGTAEAFQDSISTGQTWSGINVFWPIKGSDMVAPTEFSAMPIIDPSIGFSGYNGFGICRLDRVREGTRHVLPSRSPQEAGANVTSSSMPAIALPAFEPEEISTPDASEVVAISVAPHKPKHLEEISPEPLIEVLKEILEQDSEESGDLTMSAASQPDSRKHTDSDSNTNPVPPEASATGDSGLRPQQDNRPQDDTSSDSSRVVSLRTIKGNVGASLGGPKIVPLKVPATGAPDQAGQRLSMSERTAFRDIAKALGARFEDGSDLVPPRQMPASLSGSASDDHKKSAPESTQAPALPPVIAGTSHPYQTTSTSMTQGLGDVLVERVPVGVLVFRGDKPIYLNRPLLDLIGYTDISEFEALNGLEKLFRGRAAPSFANGEYDTVTIMGRDGQTLPVDAHLQAIDWQDEHATLVTFRRAIDAEHGPRVRSLDLELKARQADLAETRAILDTATDGVISLDENGRILALNKSAEALFGYDQNELAGERYTLLLAPESHAAALDYLDGLKANGVASVLNDGREVIGRERKGGRIPMFMTIGRVSQSGKFAAVVRDLTAWKRVESELTEAKRAAERTSALKSDFLAKVSHEIRTPMNAIIGFAEVMRDERLGPIGTERYKEYLKDIHTSGEHVISLVNDLLDLSKIEAGRMELSFGSVDLNVVVNSCLGIMQPQANRDRVIMRSQLSAKLPPVVADERSIRQIILNLLSNASKFTEPGGQVIISTALSEQGEAIIRVRDTGIGMSESDIQAAMEPFRQLASSRGRGGTGLGLPLTKALVEANRAIFTIRSKTREGTLVEITFPPTRVLAE